MSAPVIRIGMLGCGIVGSAVARVLAEHGDDIERRAGVRLRVTRVAVRDAFASRTAPLPPEAFTTDPGSVVNAPDVDIVLELIGGIEPAKELVVAAFAAGKPVVALVSGANRLDEGRLASLAGEPVAKADADTARVATGYAIGGVPPFGHATDLPVFMDRDLLGYEVVWAAAGRPDSVFEIEPERLRELSNAKVSDLKSI